MKKTAVQWKEYYSTSDFNENFLYEPADLGAFCEKERTVFKLWSPMAEEAELFFYRSGTVGEEGDSFESHKMKRGGKGVWTYTAEGDFHGVYYDFELLMEGEKIRTADPYAKASGLNGVRSMAVDLERTNPEGWEGDKAPERTEESFIYEIHVKEFSWDKSGGFPEECRGKYRAFLYPDTTLNGEGKHGTGLAYLKRLGVTHIQLMPVYDYGSVDEKNDTEFNWGYDPVNYNVPEGSYSSDPEKGEVRIRELKEMIQSLHRNGFRVIMDVVYNHTFSLDSNFQKTAPWYFYRVHEDGEVSNGSACGNDVASERYMCGKFILESVLYWAEEYHIDGFRFDLMGLLDVDLMNRIRRELDRRYGRGEKLIYGEPWAADRTAAEGGMIQALKKNISELDEHVGMFSDDIRDSIKGSVFELKTPGFANGGDNLEEAMLNSAKAWVGAKGSGVRAASQVLTYVSSHDNQTLWDKLTETTENEELRRKQYRLAAGIYMMCQGYPFFLSGEEFLRTKDGIEDSYNAPVEINRIDWARAWKEKEMVDYYRGLISLRKRLPGIYDKTKEAAERIYGQWKEDGIVGFFVDNKRRNGKENPDLDDPGWKELYLIYNRNQESRGIDLKQEEWEVLADGESSFRWKEHRLVSGKIEVDPVSVLILGRR